MGSPNFTTIVFDQDLVEEDLPSAAWTIRLADNSQIVDDVDAIGNTVVIESTDSTPDIGPDVVSYDSAGGELRSRFNGLSAVDIVDFPIT